MPKQKPHSGVQGYIASLGLPEDASDEAIRLAKKEYWKKYRTHHKRKSRRLNKECCIALTKTEKKHLEREALRHNESVAAFIKRSAMAYTRREYLTPHTEQMGRIIQILSLCYSDLERLVCCNVSEQRIRQASDAISRLEARVHDLITKPETLEEAISRTLKEKPHYITIILNIIQSL